MANKDKGVTTEDKGTFIPLDKRAPHDPENLHLSKGEFVAKKRLNAEKNIKLKEAAAQFDKEHKENAPKDSEDSKGRGRPRKIE